MRKVIINGATGAIGSALIAECISAGYEVVVLVRKDSKRMSVLEAYPEISIIQCGLSELSNTPHRSAMMGAEVFFHLAWNGTFGEERNDVLIQRKNADYTQDAVKLAAQIGCRTFVFVGSQAEFGRVEGVINGSQKESPETEYGMAKLVAGIRSRKVCKLLGMKHIYARVFSVYGPNDRPETMVSSAVRNISQGVRMKFTKGEQMWDYLYSQDAARALFLLALRGRDDKIYCIGSGEAKPLREYIETIREIVNPDCELGIGELPYAPNQVMNLCADINDLKEDTGFIPLVDFEEGIRRLNTIMNS